MIFHGFDGENDAKWDEIQRLAGWLAGWLAGGLAGWLAGWLAGLGRPGQAWTGLDGPLGALTVGSTKSLLPLGTPMALGSIPWGGAPGLLSKIQARSPVCLSSACLTRLRAVRGGGAPVS